MAQRSYVTAGVNDLATTHPALAREADGWDPTIVSAGSNKRVSWKCSHGHSWQVSIVNRTGFRTACPFCSGRRAWAGFNDLATTHPEIAKEAYGWDPKEVVAGSAHIKTWRCPVGHSYDQIVHKRTKRGFECPVCSNRQVLAGYNDLATTHPEIAKQAYGWDPSVVLKGTGQKRKWICSHGHVWSAVVVSRTANGTGCPVCAGQKVSTGFNDLLTRFPDIAAEADGWDPRQVLAGSTKKLTWLCPKGHKYESVVVRRTHSGAGCPVCAGKQSLVGYNDLSSHFPDIASEADGWNPELFTWGSSTKQKWKCPKGHSYSAAIVARTSRGNGCPICSGVKVLPGFNDIATTDPLVAKQADGWDPTTVSRGSERKKNWVCDLGHKWSSNINSRCIAGTGCPYCTGQKVLSGFNDLATLRPEIAAEAHGWDPSTVAQFSGIKKAWKCQQCGHIWNAIPSSRTREDGTGCPECGKGAYRVSEPAWFYLMQRPGEQQIGITNNIERRFRQHALNGWTEVDVVGPADGQLVLDTETEVRQWIKRELGLVPGTHENWFTTVLEVQSLRELKSFSGISTNLF